MSQNAETLQQQQQRQAYQQWYAQQQYQAQMNYQQAPRPFPPPYQQVAPPQHIANWGWVAPPGWLQFQQYMASQAQQSPYMPQQFMSPQQNYRAVPQPSRPPAPNPTSHRKNRQQVEFEDDSDDEDGLKRHDTLEHFDTLDVHEITDLDFGAAELDDGHEKNVVDAGIIEGGVAVQPAIELKETLSTNSENHSSRKSVIDSEVVTQVLNRIEESQNTERDTNASSGDRIASNSSNPGSFVDHNNNNNNNDGSKKTSNSSDNSSEPAKPRRKSTLKTMVGGVLAAVGLGSSSSNIKKNGSQKPMDFSQAIENAASLSAAARGSSLQQQFTPAAKEDDEAAVAPKEDSQLPQQQEAEQDELLQQALEDPPQQQQQQPDEEEQQQQTSSTNNEEEVEEDVAPEVEEIPKTISLKIRTLAGKVVVLDKLDRQLTLFELRELVHENFPNIPIDEQKLLFKGKMLDATAQALTLEQLNFHNNDLVHVVRQLAGGKNVTGAPTEISGINPQQQQQLQAHPQPPPSPVPSQPVLPPVGSSHMLDGNAASTSQLQMLTVLVPQGKGPGDRLRILPQGRGAMLVTVPAGVYAGDRFRVLLPPEDPAEILRAQQLLEDQRRIMEEQQLQQKRRTQVNSPPKPQIMAVVVPKGYKAGQVLDVNVPGKGKVRVTIPYGVKAGQQFKFKLPI